MALGALRVSNRTAGNPGNGKSRVKRLAEFMLKLPNGQKECEDNEMSTYSRDLPADICGQLGKPIRPEPTQSKPADKTPTSTPGVFRDASGKLFTDRPTPAAKIQDFEMLVVDKWTPAATFADLAEGI
jgi:hypothetical protein